MAYSSQKKVSGMHVLWVYALYFFNQFTIYANFFILESLLKWLRMGPTSLEI